MAAMPGLVAPDMMEAIRQEVQRDREEFFRRTRTSTAVLYAVLALVALGSGAYALAQAFTTGAAAIVVGAVVFSSLFAVSPKPPFATRTARVLTLVVCPLVGFLTTVAVSSIDSAVAAGAFAGAAAGTAVSIAWIRRRLGRDDELVLRQKRLGLL